MSDLSPTIFPGGSIAILGGGQLGRMTAMAARTMGYRVRVMDPEPICPASFVVDETIVGPWDDVDAARRLATGGDVVTLEIEQIGAAGGPALSPRRRVRATVNVHQLAQISGKRAGIHDARGVDRIAQRAQVGIELHGTRAE